MPQMKLLSKIVEYVIYALLAFVALLLVASIIPVPGGIKTFVVRSGSMEPAIKTGAVVVVLPQDNYHIGDVITFGPNTRDRVPTTHRIVDVQIQGGRYFYSTKGDANEDSDIRDIRQDDVIGKVMLDVPYLGYVVAAAQKPAGFAALIVLPALIIIYDQAARIWREVKKSRKPEVSENNEEGDKENKEN